MSPAKWSKSVGGSHSIEMRCSKFTLTQKQQRRTEGCRPRPVPTYKNLFVHCFTLYACMMNNYYKILVLLSLLYSQKKMEYAIANGKYSIRQYMHVYNKYCLSSFVCTIIDFISIDIVIDTHRNA